MADNIITDPAACLGGGPFSPLDLHFASLMGRLAADHSPELMLAAALVSRSTAAGHVCLDLAQAAGTALPQASWRCPELGPWREALAASTVVSAGSDRACPLVLDSRGRLYLYRYWLYEKKLADFFLQKAAAAVACDGALLGRLLARLFPPAGDGLSRQRLAAFTAATRRLAVICGGPGTGKTTTVAGILALLTGLADRPLRIGLAAPTGKAADRVQQAIGAALQGKNFDEAVKQGVPREAVTLHRLLGLSPDEARARFDESNPLPYDVVVVDEASMVDLPVMAKLASALSPDARLILLGDRHQLASVESGAVLGDVCADGRVEAFSHGYVEAYARAAGGCAAGLAPGRSAPPLADCIVELVDNYRFGPASGIGALAEAVKSGDSAAALGALASGGFGDLAWRQGRGAPDVEQTALRYYGGPCRAPDAAAALGLLARCRILCAVREGPRGVAGLNSAVEAILEKHRLIRRTGPWYHGRPVMVTRNDYAVNIFNGDIGVMFRDAGGGARACFARADGSQRRIAPARLPAHETAFALTVHKSQGSEFDDILVVLPDRPSPAATRELLYTAVTRARAAVTIAASAEAVAAAVERCTTRASGLRDRLAPGTDNA